MSKRTRINYEMVATERGRVINFSSFAEMALAQIDRNKTGIRNSDMRMDVQCVSILVDAVLKDNGFKYLHSAVGKSDTGIAAYYDYAAQLFKVVALGAPKWDLNGKPYLAIEFIDEKIAKESQFFATVTIDEDTDQDLINAFVEDVVIEIGAALSGKECNSLNNYSGKLKRILQYG